MCTDYSRLLDAPRNNKILESKGDETQIQIQRQNLKEQSEGMKDAGSMGASQLYF